MSVENWAKLTGEDAFLEMDGYVILWDGAFVTWRGSLYCGEFHYRTEEPSENFPEWLMYAFEAKLFGKQYTGASIWANGDA